MTRRTDRGRPEVWAGIECTVNRVGEAWFDQLDRNGHAARESDLDLLAGLGVTALRYPALWERAQRLGDEHWRWCDRRLSRLRELGVRPILGLVHHGSGPAGTSLIDPAFPEKLAAYARACAERWPWITDWTPINEPLTTARFSGLYGLWYPHGTDDATFVRCLLTETWATIRAMAAIRAVIPGARLVQTEDLGCTQSTPELAYQAEFDNERRWLSIDLLCGRVAEHHPLHQYLLDAGVGADELATLAEHACPPDIVGINHYLTSERYLDHRLDLFPSCAPGGNGKHDYVDVEAVRACELRGPQTLLREAWQRWSLPLAVTEAHLHCTREEQLRWLGEVWSAATALRADGVDLRAVTAWAALGAFDWDSLLTRDAGSYEPGLFDLRAPAPRPTALATMVRGLAAGHAPDHPLLAVPGWWRRELRLCYDIGRSLCHDLVPEDLAPLLITGRTGTLGRAFARICAVRGIPYRLTGREDFDIADEPSLRAALATLRPWAVVNTAGYVRVDEAENDEQRCWRENRDGAVALARACAELGIPLVTFSSDLVFPGRDGAPYHEGDRTAPRSAYGRSKAAAEVGVLAVHPGALVVRTAAFFGPWDRYNFVTQALQAMRRGEPWHAAHDQWVSPTYVPDLVKTSLDMLVDGERGLVHLANRGAVSWAQLAQMAAEAAGLDRQLVEPRPGAELGWVACRPRYSALGSERGIFMPTLEDGLERYLGEVVLEDAA